MGSLPAPRVFSELVVVRHDASARPASSSALAGSGCGSVHVLAPAPSLLLPLISEGCNGRWVYPSLGWWCELVAVELCSRSSLPALAALRLVRILLGRVGLVRVGLLICWFAHSVSCGWSVCISLLKLLRAWEKASSLLTLAPRGGRVSQQ